MLIIALQSYWRTMCQDVLEKAEFVVHVLADYRLEIILHTIGLKRINFVVLGCVKITEREQELITSLRGCPVRLLVLCTSLRPEEALAIFRLGADDVAEKTYDPDILVRTIEGSFASVLRSRL